MNTCLSNIYLKLCHFDSRYIRFALVVLALVGGGHFIMRLPMPGDVGG